jgi:hypothetical protein
MSLKILMGAAMASFLVLSGASGAGAALLYYGGDLDPSNPDASGLPNEQILAAQAATYDNFTVSGGDWDVTGLFTNNLIMNFDATLADWEIRSGVSEGNGGTLVASGTATPIATPTGRSFFGLTEAQVLVDVSLILAPGTYWVSVAPIDPNGSETFNSNSFGLNAVGTHTPDDDFWNSFTFGADFTNANSQGVFPAFSSGVIGTIVAIPEPATWATMLVSFAGLGFVGYGRSRKHAASPA